MWRRLPCYVHFFFKFLQTKLNICYWIYNICCCHLLQRFDCSLSCFSAMMLLISSWVFVFPCFLCFNSLPKCFVFIYFSEGPTYGAGGAVVELLVHKQVSSISNSDIENEIIDLIDFYQWLIRYLMFVLGIFLWL